MGQPGNPETSPHAQVARKGVLPGLARIFLLLDRALGVILPETLNPLLHTGSVAVVCALTATATGFILLTWYDPSIAGAWQSVEAMSGNPFPAAFHRSLHRYSSDAALMFGAIHALRAFFNGRFSGARWLAWTTGGILLWLLWAIGWTGYWLVWDMRARLVAVGTVELMGVLPIVGDQVSHSFLTDDGTTSFLLFLVFFFHMLVPFVMGAVVMFHINRLSRPRLLTDRPMTIWTLGLLLLLCVLYPATSAEPARMTGAASELTMDWWYLFPLAFIERLDGDVLWTIALASGAIFLSIPWWRSQPRTEPANVIASSCNECTRCYRDCPYAAIEMITRTDGDPKYKTQAFVIESRCVSCGVCVGSCDRGAIRLPALDSAERLRQIDGWLGEAQAMDEAPHIGFMCAQSAAGGLQVDIASGISPELPGYRLLYVPCAGWVHPSMLERALRHGAPGALIVTCGSGECLYREGALFSEQRSAGEREPSLRTAKVAPEKVTTLGLDRTRKAELIERAGALRADLSLPPHNRHSPTLSLIAATFVALIFAALIGVVSDLGYVSP
jgi:ferredoxin/coenzyme F420-reducing hydrogenase delta subunit